MLFVYFVDSCISPHSWRVVPALVQHCASRHQAAQHPRQRGHRRSQDMRPGQHEDHGAGGHKRVVHLLALLPGARAVAWRANIQCGRWYVHIDMVRSFNSIDSQLTLFLVCTCLTFRLDRHLVGGVCHCRDVPAKAAVCWEERARPACAGDEGDWIADGGASP